MKRVFIASLAFLLVLLPFNSFSNPLLVAAYVVETGAPVAAELLVANAERSVLSRIGTAIANNPVAWTSAVSTLADGVVQYFMGPASNPTKYVVPANSTDPIPKPAPKTVTVTPPGYSGPSFFTGPAARCLVSGNYVNIGPFVASSLQEVAAAYESACPSPAGYGPIQPFVVDTIGPLRALVIRSGNTNFFPAANWCGLVGECVEVAVSCPPGSTLDISGVCKGEEADGQKRFLRTPNGFIPDLSDPDWNNQIPSGWSADGQPISISGTDAYGRPVLINISPAGAGSTVTVQNQSVNSLNQPTLSQGQLQVAGDRTVVTNNYSTVSNTTIQQGGSSAPVSIKFPDDYARDATVSGLSTYLSAGYIANLQAVGQLTASNAHLDKIESAVSNAGETPPDPTFNDNNGRTLKDSFNNGNPLTGLLSWQLPAHKAECPIAEFDALGNHFVFNSHCYFADQLRTQIQALFGILFTLAAFFIIIGA